MPRSTQYHYSRCSHSDVHRQTDMTQDNWHQSKRLQIILDNKYSPDPTPNAHNILYIISINSRTFILKLNGLSQCFMCYRLALQLFVFRKALLLAFIVSVISLTRSSGRSSSPARMFASLLKSSSCCLGPSCNMDVRTPPTARVSLAT